MRKVNPEKVFVQYRDKMKPYEPVMTRKYTITHSDRTADLFVFAGERYAEDKINKTRDEVRLHWERNEKGLVLIGSVLVDGEGVKGLAVIRNKIFYKEMPTALQALRQGDRFLFDKDPSLDKTQIFIHFISSKEKYDKVYSFGVIGDYKI